METSSLPIERESDRSGGLPKRGLIVAVIAIGLGLCLVKPVEGTIAWGDLAVLASLAVVSVFGANEAKRLVHQRQFEAETSEVVVEPHWMTVVIQSSGPADTAGVVAVPKSPPRKDPERRSLLRRAKERRTVGASNR